MTGRAIRYGLLFSAPLWAVIVLAAFVVSRATS